jgi:hypothetical protein
MANPSKKKGTGWEVELLGRLQALWPAAERAALAGVADRGDFTGVPVLIEAKCTGAPHFLEWARNCSRKADRWVVAWHGDRRSVGCELAVMPLEFALAAVAAWKEAEEWTTAWDA